MAAAAMLRKVKKPTDEEIDTYMSNICRCGTYPRIRAAIHRAAAGLASNAPRAIETQPSVAEVNS